MMRVLLQRGGVQACPHIVGGRVPKHAGMSRVNSDYEPSTRAFRFSMSTIVPPQCGQRQVVAGFVSPSTGS
jgi:hypothetical protein